MHIKTVILLGHFFHLVCVMLLICEQRFLFNFFYSTLFTCFIFFIKNAFFNVFYSWGQRVFYIYGSYQGHPHVAYMYDQFPKQWDLSEDFTIPATEREISLH